MSEVIKNETEQTEVKDEIIVPAQPEKDLIDRAYDEYKKRKAEAIAKKAAKAEAKAAKKAAKEESKKKISLGAKIVTGAAALAAVGTVVFKTIAANRTVSEIPEGTEGTVDFIDVPETVDDTVTET